MVPVLSKATVLTWDRVSIKLEPLISTPALLAPPIPAKKLSGMLMTSAQGQLMTRKVRALYSQSPQRAGLPVSSRKSGGRTASASAAIHTAGV